MSWIAILSSFADVFPGNSIAYQNSLVNMKMTKDIFTGDIVELDDGSVSVRSNPTVASDELIKPHRVQFAELPVIERVQGRKVPRAKGSRPARTGF
eukprot:CAMPEP_0182443618 /NCGR_PEP_ID=MMETSP1172-20130603/2315_1 /TAXON_ID=708627 /ORGANISM="Timspurckia oligopyrenoides, Strain CCMP3278" /LENGTH=95 /DNA_ID=CAMNT_0024638963 /DNA_START=332 /DNA_END=619 /DNA_ORIENTATION=+